MASSNFPGRPFRLEEGVYVYQQNSWNTGNNTLIHSELWVRKNSYSPTWAGSGGSFQMYVVGTLVGANGNFGYDFRNSDQMLLHASNNWFQNDGAGNLWVPSDGYANMGAMGATEVHGGIWTPRIPRPPGAPFSYPNAATALTEITATSMRYQFSGTTDGGSAITGWEIDYSTTSNFAAGTVQTVASNGLTTVTGLIPGTQYWFRARGRNATGWGAYGDTATATTLPSVKVSNGSSWLAPQVLMSNGTVWTSPQAFVSVGGAWVNPLP